MRAAWLQQYGERINDREQGLSLIELMIVLALAAILVGLAVPSFQSLVARNHLTATTNTLVFSLQTARSEAIKRSLPAGVCTSNNSLDANASCSAGSGFVSGWIAYVDNNGNGSRDAEEEIVMAVEDRGAGFTITPDNRNFLNQIYFDATGGSSNTSGTPLSGSVAISYGDGSETRTVEISATGRVATVAN